MHSISKWETRGGDVLSKGEGTLKPDPNTLWPFLGDDSMVYVIDVWATMRMRCDFYGDFFSPSRECAVLYVVAAGNHNVRLLNDR